MSVPTSLTGCNGLASQNSQAGFVIFKPVEWPLVKTGDMKLVEEWTVREKQVPELDMIRLAARAVFRQIQRLYRENEWDPSRPCLFLCGKGHNGADALESARLWEESGGRAVVYHWASAKGYSAETQVILNNLEAAGVGVLAFETGEAIHPGEGTALVVDGLLGAGLSRPASGVALECIEKMNAWGIPVLSVDLPSGLYSDAPEAVPAVKARATQCLGSYKISAAFFPARENYGEVAFDPLCFPPEKMETSPSFLRFWDEKTAASLLPRPDFRDHKYSTGKVLILGGSLGMQGAPVLATGAAMCSGAGMVRVAVPSGIHSIVAGQALEALVFSVGNAGTGHFTAEDVRTLKEHLDWARVVLIGPGLGRHPETRDFFWKVFEGLHKPVVIDGDGLFFLAEDPARFTSSSGPRILTPHSGEFKRLTGRELSQDPWERVEHLRRWASEQKFHLVVKSSTTLCASPSGDVRLSFPGSPALATAGTGDVLAGIIAAFLCRQPPGIASMLGVYCHARAGHLAAVEKGVLATRARDVLASLPEVLRRLESPDS